MITLPGLCLLQDCSGDWDLYLEKVFGIFKKDFMGNSVKYNGAKVFYIHKPEYKGRPFSFWHLISEGKNEDQRNTDLRRCERISWPRIIIENSNEQEIKVWRSERKNKKGKKQGRLCLCFGNWEYLVILTIRDGYYILCTAYPIETGRRKFQLKNEYKEFQEKQTPPLRAASDAPSTSW